MNLIRFPYLALFRMTVLRSSANSVYRPRHKNGDPDCHFITPDGVTMLYHSVRKLSVSYILFLITFQKRFEIIKSHRVAPSAMSFASGSPTRRRNNLPQISDWHIRKTIKWNNMSQGGSSSARERHTYRLTLTCP